jgi:hypothetical protein
MLVPAAVLVALLATGCGGSKGERIGSDQIGCVYSSADSGSEFKRVIRPGERADIGGSDQLVLLPTNDQVYNMSTTGGHTQGAPTQVLAFTRGQVAVYVEGVLKFRFNTAGDTACAWYTKYGLGSSYGDFGFAVRPDAKTPDGQPAPPPSHDGYYRFLAESHGNTMKQVVHDGSAPWTWQQLAYGSDPAVKTKPTNEPISVGYGKHIGAMFSRYLRLNLGKGYFCGVQPGLSGAGETEGCPPIYFQVLSVSPRDKALAEEHDALKRLDAQLQRQRQAARLKAQNRATAIASAKAQRKVFEAQIVNTRLAALNDLKVQKCLILARVGLDCEGKKPDIIVPGLAK